MAVKNGSAIPAALAAAKRHDLADDSFNQLDKDLIDETSKADAVKANPNKQIHHFTNLDTVADQQIPTLATKPPTPVSTGGTIPTQFPHA